MAPIRSILASRAAIIGLLLLCCLALFLYTINIQPEFFKTLITITTRMSTIRMSTTDKNVNNKNVNNKNVNNLDVNSNLLIPFHELKGVDGDGVYHGRSDRSTHYVLEQVEDFYKRILRQRKHWLAERKFGTRYFVKKIVSIMERLVLVVVFLCQFLPAPRYPAGWTPFWWWQVDLWNEPLHWRASLQMCHLFLWCQHRNPLLGRDARPSWLRDLGIRCFRDRNGPR